VLAAARASGAKLGVADFERLQHDETSLQARELVPLLLSAAQRRGRAGEWVYGTFAGWDYVMRAEGTAPLIFDVWSNALSRALFHYRFRDAAPTAAAIVGDAGWLDAFEHPATVVESFGAARDSLLVVSMDSTLAELRARLGSDNTTWRWGTVHTASFPHAIAKAFDLAPVSRGGNGSTVNSTAGPNYRQTHGASFREILDVADWDRSVATSVPGQSGQPESEYYGNLLPLWARGEYFPLSYSRGAVERDTRHVLWLRPAARSTSQR
jgi:penicillin amidase